MIYSCPECGQEEDLDPDDWRDAQPACPVELYDPVTDEMTGDASCPDSYMLPVRTKAGAA